MNVWIVALGLLPGAFTTLLTEPEKIENSGEDEEEEGGPEGGGLAIAAAADPPRLSEAAAAPPEADEEETGAPAVAVADEWTAVEGRDGIGASGPT